LVVPFMDWSFGQSQLELLDELELLEAQELE
jgi:hypothetical protein